MTGFDDLLAALNVSVGRFALHTLAAEASETFEAEGEPIALYVLEGSGLLSACGHAAMPLDRDAFVILPRGLAFEVESTSGVSAALGSFAATFGGAAGPFDGLRGTMVASFASRPMRENFLTLVDELGACGVGSRALAACIVKQALVMVMRDALAAGSEAALPWIVAIRDDRLGRAVGAMLDRPSDPLTLDALAHLAGMSRSAFAERFNAAFGRSPIDFLREIRLGRAARMLSSTDLPVKRIASAVGYESRSYFSRAFRSRYDIDPSDYRVTRPVGV